MRRSGIEVVGEVPWGTHFCQFYETAQDLTEMLVPYFREGLAGNEFCMWVTAPPLGVEQAAAALQAEVPGLDRQLREGQIEILDYSQWYTRSGRFSAEEVLQGWVDKLTAARQRGYEGLRLTGNTLWLEPGHWDDFTQYEEMVNNVISEYRMLALCTYSLRKCGAAEIMDVLSNHQFALVKRAGRWEIIESARHKQTENALRESEQQWEQTFDSIPDLIAILDPQHRIVRANRAMAERLGTSPEQCRGLTCFQCVHGLDAPLDFCPHAQTLADGREHVAEIHENRLGGDFLVSCTPLFDPQGQCFGSVHVARDITAHKKAEQALHESREDLNRAQAVGNIGSWRLDVQRNELTWSDENHRIFGIPKGTPMTYETFLSTVHPDDREYVDRKWKAGLAGENYDIEHRIVVDGQIKWVREKAYLEFDGEGELLGGFGITQDITEHKRAEVEIHSLARFPEENPNPVMRAAISGELLYGNRPAISLLAAMGWQKDGALPEVLLGPVRRVLEQGAYQEVEFVSLSGRLYAFALSPSTGEGRVNLYGRDITERKRAEEMLRKSRDELERRVRERTAELAQTVSVLQDEVQQRIQAEEAVKVERQRLFSLLNCLPGYVVLKDRDHQIRFASHGFLEVFGEPSGRPCYKVEHGLDHPCNSCPIPGVLDDRRPSDFERIYPNGQFYHVSSFPFTDTDGRPLMMQLGLNITERKRLESMVVEASEAERRRIGRDLHDTLGQSLTGLGYLVAGLSKKLADTSPEGTAAAKQIIETVQDAVAQIRALSTGLDPMGLEADGLANALSELAYTVQATTGISCRVQCDQAIFLEPSSTRHLYRIVQEALNNAAKHAHAKQVVISLTGDAESLTLRVEDDGVGIADGARDGRGMGLRIMEYRAGVIGAPLAVRAGDNGGTIVTCALISNAPGSGSRGE